MAEARPDAPEGARPTATHPVPQPGEWGEAAQTAGPPGHRTAPGGSGSPIDHSHVGDRRSLGLDLGSTRIGVALCDSGGRLATPYDLLLRSGQRSIDHRRIAELVEEADATRVIVGLPRSLSGAVGPAARAVLEEIAELAGALDVPVFTQDERLSTVTAHHNLRRSGLNGVRARKVVDQVAAAVLLQAFLDAEQAQAREQAGQGDSR